MNTELNQNDSKQNNLISEKAVTELAQVPTTVSNYHSNGEKKSDIDIVVGLIDKAMSAGITNVDEVVNYNSNICTFPCNDSSDLSVSEKYNGNKRSVTVMINGESVVIDGIDTDFSIINDGLYYDEFTENPYVSSVIYVHSYVQDVTTKEWMVRVLFKDFTENWQNLLLSMSDVSSNASRLVQALSTRGIYCAKSRNYQLYQYVRGCRPSRKLQCVDKPGWCEGQYVMPEELDLVSYNNITYSPSDLSKNQYQVLGAEQLWKEKVASLCPGNSRLVISVCLAFGSVLMPLLGGRTCGFHFYAPSSRGKTTVLKLAKSVMGSPEDLVSWRTTDNALENIAAEHNHSILCLDELAQMAESNLKRVGESIYMLGNEEGKSRYYMNGNPKTWRMYFLSSGELSLRDTFSSGKKNTKAGQEVRFIDVPAEVNTEYGILDTIHDFPNSRALVDELNRNVELYHGTAGRAFIRDLTEDKELYLSIARDFKDEFLSALDLSGADAQVCRVADHFATVAAAGELASKFEITGWAIGQSTWAAKQCFDAWINQRGGEDSQEEQVAITTVQDKLIQYGHNKFITNENPKPRGQYWGKREGNDYFVFASVFNNQICSGINAKQAINALVNKGFITLSSDGRNTVTKRIDGKVARCFHLNETLFNEDNNLPLDVEA